MLTRQVTFLLAKYHPLLANHYHYSLRSCDNSLSTSLLAKFIKPLLADLQVNPEKPIKNMTKKNSLIDCLDHKYARSDMFDHRIITPTTNHLKKLLK